MNVMGRPSGRPKKGVHIRGRLARLRGLRRGPLLFISVAVCIGAVAPGSASAGRDLTLQTAAGAIRGGGAIQLQSTDLSFATPVWNLECTTIELGAELTDNGAVKDLGQLTSGAFRGGEPGGACRTTSALGPAAITVGGIPGRLVFTDRGRAELEGVKKLTLLFSFLGAGGLECNFKISKLKGTFNPNGPLGLATQAQRFKTIGSLSAPVCPREANLSAGWSVSSAGETVEAHLG